MANALTNLTTDTADGVTTFTLPSAELAAKLPPTMRIHGTALASGYEAEGHGIWLQPDGVAALLHHEPFHLMADHSHSIRAVAGTVRPSGVNRFRATIPRRKRVGHAEPESYVESFEEDAASLDFTAELSETFEGYETAARFVLGMREQKRTPHVSVAIKASSLSYDEPTDRLFFVGPYTLSHLAIVGRGALKPKEGGVGVHGVDFSAPPADTLLRMHPMAPGLTGGLIEPASRMEVIVENAVDLCAEFAASHLEDSDLLERVGAHLGVGGLRERAASAKLAANDEDSNSEVEVDDNRAANMQPTGETMSNPPSPAAAPVVVPPASVPDSAAMAALEGRLAKLEADNRTLALEAKKSDLKARFGATDDELKGIETTDAIAAFAAFATRLGTPAPGGSGLPLGAAKRDVLKPSDAQLAMKELDEGRDAFLSEVALGGVASIDYAPKVKA